MPSPRPVRRPTLWCSTRAPFGRMLTTGCMETSDSCCPRNRAIPVCRLPSAVASPRKTKASSSSERRGVDVVFGTHNIGSLPVLLERARVASESQVELIEALEDLPLDSARSAGIGVPRLGQHQCGLQ